MTFRRYGPCNHPELMKLSVTAAVGALAGRNGDAAPDWRFIGVGDDDKRCNKVYMSEQLLKMEEATPDTVPRAILAQCRRELEAEDMRRELEAAAEPAAAAAAEHPSVTAARAALAAALAVHP